MSLVDDWDDDDLNAPPVAAINPFDDFRGMDTGRMIATSSAAPLSPVQQPAAVEDEANCPFSLRSLDFQLPPGEIKTVACSNNVMAIACGIATILIVDVMTRDSHEVTVSRTASIHKLFLDTVTGKHLLVCLQNGETLYINTQSAPKPRPVFTKQKLKIECVAWDKQSVSSSATGEILLGTTNGLIFETQIADGKEKYLKQVFSLPDSIVGLQMERFPSDNNKFFVMAVAKTQTSMQQFQFIGSGSLSEMFAQYTTPAFSEMPGNVSHSDLHFFSKYQGVAKTFAWLTSQGIMYGDLQFGAQNTHDTVAEDSQLLQYPPPTNNNNSNSNSNSNSIVVQHPEGPILSFSKFDFHFVVLLPTAVVAINQVTENIVWSQELARLNQGHPVGVAHDPFDNKAFVYTDSSIFEVVVDREDRDMWRVYLQKNDFDTAIDYCKTSGQRDRVLCAKADHYFNQNKLDMAATFYAQTSKPFEEVALKLVGLPSRDALKAYLTKKLETVPRTNKTQLSLLCMWLLETSLNKLNMLHDAGHNEQYMAAKDDLELFIEKWAPEDVLHKQTVVHLISSQGRMDVLLVYARVIGDYHTVVSHHIQEREWPTALDVLASQHDNELWYKFAATLMEHVPVETVDKWVLHQSFETDQTQQLDPRRLIPALMRYNVENNPPGVTENQALRYLRKCVDEDGVRDEAVVNFLVTLYARQTDDTDLMNFLEFMQNEPEFDLKYALRMCTKEGKSRACIHIYMQLEMFEEAVQLALEDTVGFEADLELAKQCANGPVEDDALKKRLWLRIAKYVVEAKSDPKQAIELLSECDLLKIEDILPFFPDSVRIDLFKDEVCESLREYNMQIKRLKEDMDEATRNATQIRNDISELRNRYIFLSPNQRCELSSQPVLGRAFYGFPCHHVFLQEFLVREVLPHLTEKERAEVNQIQEKLARANLHEQGPDLQLDSTLSAHDVQHLKARLDELIARECPLCGTIMIESIGTPLNDNSDRSWDIESPFKTTSTAATNM